MPKEKKKKEKKAKEQRKNPVYDSFTPDEEAEETLEEITEEEGSQNGAVLTEEHAAVAEPPEAPTVIVEGDYSAAFEHDLLGPTFLQQAFLAQLAPGSLLPHSGRVRLVAEGLEFEGLISIPFAEMTSVEVHTDRVYHRYYAGLAALSGRGGSHMLAGGEPFVIVFREQGEPRTLYAVLDWPFFLALTKEKGWRKAVGGVLPAKEKKKG